MIFKVFSETRLGSGNPSAPWSEGKVQNLVSDIIHYSAFRSPCPGGQNVMCVSFVLKVEDFFPNFVDSITHMQM